MQLVAIKQTKIIILLLFALLWLFLPWTVLAQSTKPAINCSGQILDKQRVVVLCSPGYATASDRITVYLREGTNPNLSWRENLDQTNSVWAFETGSTGRTSLVIDFHKDSNGLIADFYLDRDGNKTVSYDVLQDGTLNIKESVPGPAYWAYRVIAKDGWWERNGKINFNLDIQIDAAVATNVLYQSTINLVKTDGKVDFLVHVRDSDNDGLPDYEWREAFLPLSEDDAYFRTTIMVNTKHSEIPISGSIFWPYLGNNYNDLVKPYNSSPPPFEMDWQEGTIKFLGEFVASRGNPDNYFIYTFQRWKPGELLEANFENPFTFYNLSGINDGYPDLAVRMEDYMPKDRYYQYGLLNIPVEEVEYTWDQEHHSMPQKSWNYMVSLVGKRPVDKLIKLPELTIKSIPYQEMPTWVTGGSWDAATFVAVEKKPYWTSKHIYTWTTFAGGNNHPDLREDYITGLSSQKPTDNYNSIQAGFRGEYNFQLNNQPYLYFSSVDRKLHLLTAETGIWNIDDHSEIHYANLNGGRYINQWSYQIKSDNSSTTVIRQLNQSQNYLVYGGENEVIIRQAQVKPSLFETLPPTNNAEWKTLGDRLNANSAPFDPTDFKAMLRQFPGPELSVSNATMRDYRSEDKQSFRFVLTLQPGFQVQGTDLLGISKFAPGEYIATYTGGEFKLEPATPPDLSVSFNVTQLKQLEQSSIPVTLGNAGLLDGPSGTLELWATSPAGRARLVDSKPASFPGRQTVPLSFQWAPNLPGTWTLSLRMSQPDGKLLSFPTSKVMVAPSGVVSPEKLVLSSNSLENLPLLLMLPLLFASLVAIVFWTNWKTNRKGQG
ncbi:MAG TPA: hypothetical protein VH186_29055 [Chloroflexia bacterium]|nr:hypothetical protein [Chloroflexia bacterium]